VVTVAPAVITIGVDPTIEIGPVTIAWHGLTIAVGILIGALAAAYDARRRGLDPQRLYAIAMIVVIGALVGGRVFYLLEQVGWATQARGSEPPVSLSTGASSRPR
jgi:prolipoprotein diacylglyceryltransferase